MPCWFTVRHRAATLANPPYDAELPNCLVAYLNAVAILQPLSDSAERPVLLTHGADVCTKWFKSALVGAMMKRKRIFHTLDNASSGGGSPKFRQSFYERCRSPSFGNRLSLNFRRS